MSAAATGAGTESRVPVPLTASDRPLALTALAGGALVALGAFLPWLSFFAGLYPVRGVLGLWGRLLAAGGVVCVLAGMAELWHPDRRLRLGIAVLGWALAAFAGWLTLQLLLTFRQLQADVMMVPRRGPGLVIVLAGTLVTSVPALARLRRG